MIPSRNLEYGFSGFKRKFVAVYAYFFLIVHSRFLSFKAGTKLSLPKPAIKLTVFAFL